ncbi:ABC transporter permease [Schleiferilactobacillus harbinensis]|jgi:putative ABC transport system permease protein|uniref:ABC transporter permease n=1 Tax=Schleiferilactobacillus harbinensis TaxID=304207 RepID=A0A5P8M1H0_9LACO|nr:ABC transporter permease [Schleiferilactobacillus harbinensis]MCI1849535.1 ABC transporter permease [Schleiferilactobacillus harbinensis]QFR22135.1 ABC transporter permease [Schleiferilactobacillus harbinensis]
MDILLSSISQGLIWSIMAIGVYLTFRILDIADMTAEGAFPLGAAFAASLIANHANPWLATLVGMLGGMAAGLVSGLLYTRLRIPALLTGILTLTGLYSINLRIMGKANIALLNQTTVFSAFAQFSSTMQVIIVGALLVAVIMVLLVLFFNTEMGLAARAVGDNPDMSAANGVHVANMQIVIYMISNGLIALAGALMAQSNGYADISMGVGTIVIALAAIIIGEVLVRNLTLGKRILTIIAGAVIYRLIIAFVLWRGVDPNDLRLFYAALLTVLLAVPLMRQLVKQGRRRRLNKAHIAKLNVQAKEDKAK